MKGFIDYRIFFTHDDTYTPFTQRIPTRPLFISPIYS